MDAGWAFLDAVWGTVWPALRVVESCGGYTQGTTGIPVPQTGSHKGPPITHPLHSTLVPTDGDELCASLMPGAAYNTSSHKSPNA